MCGCRFETQLEKLERVIAKNGGPFIFGYPSPPPPSDVMTRRKRLLACCTGTDGWRDPIPCALPPKLTCFQVGKNDELLSRKIKYLAM
jgi:hypothetical protein